MPVHRASRLMQTVDKFARPFGLPRAGNDIAIPVRNSG